ncbi:MAG: peptidoglycan-binding protein [Clostridia bacterium]|nr:peptidoglycan-binding protein [Clostridia bacterium]
MEHMLPEDFAERYASEYRLSGNEAGVRFDIVLNSPVEVPIIPQNVIDVAFCSADGTTVDRGFQLMDAEMDGNFDVVVTPGVDTPLYKRYVWNEAADPMKYMVVSSFVDGQERLILFDMEDPRPKPEPEAEEVPEEEPEEEPEPEIVYAPLQKGDRSEAVKALQQRLIDLKYLNDKADGIFGKKTEKAVKAAQEAFGLEQTGIADNELQHRLFDDAE